MRPTEFNEIVEEQITMCHSMLVSKREEYVTGTDDVLHNFKQAAHLQDSTLRQAIAGMMVKHTVSVFDMIRDTRQYPLLVWDEKITDSINYLLLLKAVLLEESDGAALEDVIKQRQKVLEEIELEDEDEVEDHVEYPDTPNV
jgi:hypothetical protein